MKLPDWDGSSKPPRSHVIAHRILGPPMALATALYDGCCKGWREGRRSGRASYGAVRSWHADRWHE